MTEHYLRLPRDLSQEDLTTLQAACDTEEAARDRVRELLERRPDLLRSVDAPAVEAERRVSGSQQVLCQEITRAQQQELRESLAEPDDGALEHLLIERIALVRLALLRAEETRAVRTSGQVDERHARYLDQHVAKLSGDFLRACKTLAKVRKLRLGSVQINVAEQQLVIG